ncbi:MAG: hypothetical protein WDW38_005537 [Sanguina aurantia]
MSPLPVSQWWIIGFAVLARLAIGLSSYSGANDAPTFGDYEAQRHWMEITVALPPATWYEDSEHNNMTYWPLDYPPSVRVSGEREWGTDQGLETDGNSWLCGKVLGFMDPMAVALGSSRGHESATSKRIMRLTVVVSDLLVFIPACLAVANLLLRRSPSSTRRLALAAMLLQPAGLLIDHGHFQYNGISLGLAAAAAVAICEGAPLLGSVLFSLSLNHKQMALFYAPAFSSHTCWAGHSRGRDSPGRGSHSGARLSAGAGRLAARSRPETSARFCSRVLSQASAAARPGRALAVAQLGLAVVATFVVCWAPFISQPGGVMQVLHRIFPVKRGLYQDYLSNFWCATSLLMKWRQLFEAPLLAAGLQWDDAGRVPLPCCSKSGPPRAGDCCCAWPTAPSLPTCSATRVRGGASPTPLLRFGCQVHEKSILLPLLPVMMLAPWEPCLATWLPLIASFSMYPLLERDGLALTYLACCLLYTAFAWPGFAQLAATTAAFPHAGGGGGGGPAASSRSGRAAARLAAHAAAAASAAQALCARRRVGIASTGLAVAVVLHVARALVPPPPGLLWLHDRLFVTAAFIALVPCVLWLQVQQWCLGVDSDADPEGCDGCGAGVVGARDAVAGAREDVPVAYFIDCFSG